MKKILIGLAFICAFTTPLMSSPVSSSALMPIEKIVPNEILLKKITSLKIKDLQKLAGRKFSLKEKIAFLVLKQQLKHKPSDSKSQGQTALIFGIVGLALFIVGLFVPYVIIGSLISSIIAIVVGSVAKKKNPSDGKAHAGKLLGWITLGLIALLLIIAVIAIATWF
jgi:hypothetical protein